VTDRGGDRPDKSIRNPDDLSAEEVEARLGIPITAETKVRRSAVAAPTEPVPHAATRRRVLWRDSATILIGVVVALLVVRFLLPSGPATADASPSPDDTGIVAVASATLAPTPTDATLATLGNVVPPSLHLDATPTPIPVITLPPATPRPQPTPTLKPGQTPGPTATPKATPHKTPAPTPLPAPIAKVTCSVPTGSMTVTCSGAGTLYAVTYEWTFGDGATATGRTPPPHLYATNGTYTVTLTATNVTGSDSQNAFAIIPGP
jgi:PKD domain